MAQQPRISGIAGDVERWPKAPGAGVPPFQGMMMGMFTTPTMTQYSTVPRYRPVLIAWPGQNDAENGKAGCGIAVGAYVPGRLGLPMQATVSSAGGCIQAPVDSCHYAATSAESSSCQISRAARHTAARRQNRTGRGPPAWILDGHEANPPLLTVQQRRGQSPDAASGRRAARRDEPGHDR